MYMLWSGSGSSSAGDLDRDANVHCVQVNALVDDPRDGSDCLTPLLGYRQIL